MAAITPNVSWTQSDTFANQYTDIINTVHGKPDAKLYPDNPNFAKNITAFTNALKARHVLYWVNHGPTYVNGQLVDPSDTDQSLSLSTIQAQNPDLGTAKTLGTITSTTKYVGIATGAALTLGHAGVGALAAGTAIGGALGIASIAAFGVGLAVMPIMIIMAHHAAAVAAEHVNNAKATDYANAYLNEIQPLIGQGQVTLAEWDAFAKTLMADFCTLNQPSYNVGNMAWVSRWEFACVLELYRRVVVMVVSQITQSLSPPAVAPPPVVPSIAIAATATVAAPQVSAANPPTVAPPAQSAPPAAAIMSPAVVPVAATMSPTALALIAGAVVVGGGAVLYG